MYATVRNSTILSAVNFRELRPDVSFKPGISDQELADNFNLYPVLSQKSHDSTIEKLTLCDVYKEGDIFYCVIVENKLTEDAQVTAMEAVYVNFAGKIASGFTYGGHIFDIDDTAQSNMNAVQTAFLTGVQNAHGGYWRSMDNQNVDMDDTEVQTFFVQAFAYKAGLIRKAQLAKDAIIVAATVSEVNAIDVSLD